MLQGGGSGGWWLVISLPLLPLLAYLCALCWHGRPWSTRDVPSAAFRILTGVAFATWVHPVLGAFAALAAWHWLRTGWTLAPGGTLWPVIAMATWLGWQAPAWALDATLAGLLASGVVQVLIACSQWKGTQGLFYVPMMGPHGTIGHRTGFGIYLALLAPMGFATDYGWALCAVYALGIMLSRSTVAVAAFAAGLVVVQPWVLWFAPLAPLLALGRLIERHSPTANLGDRWHLGRWCFQPIFYSPPGRPRDDSWWLRTSVWKATLAESTKTWTGLLLGHGAGSFRISGRKWMGRYALREIYQEAHNDYLEKFYEYGAAGGLITLYAAAVLLDRVSPSPYLGVLAATAVAMLANFPLSVAPLVSVAWFALMVLSHP